MLVWHEHLFATATATRKYEILIPHRPWSALVPWNNGLTDGPTLVCIPGGRLLVPERTHECLGFDDVGIIDDSWMGAALHTRGGHYKTADGRKFRIWVQRRTSSLKCACLHLFWSTSGRNRNCL